MRWSAILGVLALAGAGCSSSGGSATTAPVAAAATSATADGPSIERRRRLSRAALAVTNQKVRRAYSPILIAGGVRVADFVVLSLLGILLYF